MRLAADADGPELRFFVWTADSSRLVGPVLDASTIWDEAGHGEHGSVTGAFVRAAAFDTSECAAPADSDWFSYTGRDG